MATPKALKLNLAELQRQLNDYLSSDAGDEFSDEERHLVEQFRLLPKDRQELFTKLLDDVAEKFSEQNRCTNYARDDDDYLSTNGLPAKGTPLNDCTWEQISAVSKAGLGADYFNIGDCKEITLNGKIGDCLTLNNEKLCVYILHFNYPINGAPDNNIIWGGFKNSYGKDVALCDGKYGKYDNGLMDGTICFNMNHRGQTRDYKINGWCGTNYGGWKGSDFRYDILGVTSIQPGEYKQLKSTRNFGYNAIAETLINPKANTLLVAALPSDFRGALRLWRRWINATGNKANVEANIEETIDAITLLTRFEVHGIRSRANEYEQNHQTQMDYFKNDNGKIKCKHNSTSSAVW